MGHRTLVAYERDGYDLHYAHWGVSGEDITPATPYGGSPATQWARAAAADRIEPAGGWLAEPHGTAVDPDPIATGVSFEAVVGFLDPVAHEALSVVDPAYDVRSYLVVALGRHAGPRGTALVSYEDAGECRYLRGWVAGARAACDVARESAGPPTVAAALRWLDPDRGTVVFPAADREVDDATDQDPVGGDDGDPAR